MPFTLARDAEERLRVVAGWRGQSPEATLIDLINQALCGAEAEIGTALLASQAEFDAGGGLTLEELDARLTARLAAKHQEQQAA